MEAQAASEALCF